MATSNTYTPSAPTATTGQGSAVSNREDLTSLLTILEPENNPVTALIPKGSAKSTFHEWTLDSLDTPVTTGVSEGSDVTSFDDKFAARARLGNYVQKWRKPYRVSDIQQAVTSVGPADIGQARAKAVREIKRDIEATICSDNDRTVENGAGTPYAMRALGDWLDSAGPADVPAAYRTSATSIITTTPTESSINDMIGQIYTETGEVNDITFVVGTSLRKLISNFMRAEGTTTSINYLVNEPAASKKITLAVNIFESDFGMVKIVNGNPACLPDANRGYAIIPKYLGFSTLKPMRVMDLEDQGGGPRGFVDCVATLEMRHPQAHGKVDY